jgi:hypothetical protein
MSAQQNVSVDTRHCITARCEPNVLRGGSIGSVVDGAERRPGRVSTYRSDRIVRSAALRAVIEAKVRPRLEQMMAPENWWRRFNGILGL